MDAGILAQRDGLALRRMTAACDRLSRALALPDVSASLAAVTGEPGVKAMKQRELLAAWLETAAEHAEAKAKAKGKG